MTPPVNAAEAVVGYATHDLDLRMETTDQMIARVLGRAHEAAMATGAPAQARTILMLAQSFADELAASDSAFDRRTFLEAVIEDPS